MDGICSSRDLQCQTQGASLGITKACALEQSPTCSVTCASATMGAGSCIILDSNFIDGTPCGYAGVCSNGACQNGSGLNAAKAWYTQKCVRTSSHRLTHPVSASRSQSPSLRA